MFNLLKPVGPSRAPANQSPTHLPKPKIGFQNPKLSASQAPNEIGHYKEAMKGATA